MNPCFILLFALCSLAGMVCALMVGLCGGSILVPMNYVPKSQSGLVFVPSFGIGAMLASPLVCMVGFGYQSMKGKPLPHLHLVDTLVPGIISGLLWNISNVLAIIAIPQIGYAVAYPFLQCALLVGGLWGVFVFHEISGLAVKVFFSSGVVLIVGAVALALAGQAP
jgi:hypothetical protein